MGKIAVEAKACPKRLRARRRLGESAAMMAEACDGATAAELDALLAEVGACRLCAETLPLGPRPVLRASATAKLPDRRPSARAPRCTPAAFLGTTRAATASGTGSRSRARFSTTTGGSPSCRWASVIRDAMRVAGDLPPRPECARAWQARLLPLLASVELVLLVGQYAQKWHLGRLAKPTLTETVRAWRDYLPGHPATAASFLANRRLGPAQPLVRGGGGTGTAPPRRRPDRIRAMRHVILMALGMLALAACAPPGSGPRARARATDPGGGGGPDPPTANACRSPSGERRMQMPS